MTEPRKIARYGWIPDLPDERDHIYAAPPQFLSALPPATDLRALCPGVYDQGMLGSCTANAIGGAIEFDRMKQKLTDFVPSRLFIYYNERLIEGTVNSDSGAQIRDGIKTVASQGVCPEPEWPYDITKFTTKPPAKAYKDSATDRAVSYQSLIQDLNQMKGCLASGYPFVFGFTVYESFESAAVANSGHAPMPAPSERAIGGHGVVGGVWRATSRCHTHTSSSRGFHRTSGRSESSAHDGLAGRLASSWPWNWPAPPACWRRSWSRRSRWDSSGGGGAACGYSWRGSDLCTRWGYSLTSCSRERGASATARARPSTAGRSHTRPPGGSR